MIVSWKWLQDYVSPGCSSEEVTERLTMSGMNLESMTPVADDLAIDLEVTSNRTDCLGHLGVAREISVVCDAEFRSPESQLPDQGPNVGSFADVQVNCPELCPQYVARVIQGVRIGPSPTWLQDRLRTLGVASVNNVVDVTNYVLLECGQPLHAFDADRLRERRIVVRRAEPGEQLEAIDHRTYRLTPDMCVIADAKQPVAIAGVMGGAASEVHSGTRTVLIESAAFAPAAVRATARALNLHSPSSFRFERGIDRAAIDWASRRCCELILQTAGGELLAGAVGFALSLPPSSSVTLRLARIPRVIGIEISEERCAAILQRLGLLLVGSRPGIDSTWRIPSWRRDLTREIDLIEEVARVEGYHRIPEDVPLPSAAVADRPSDAVRKQVQQSLTAAGLDEVLCFSFTTEESAGVLTPPGAAAPLRVVPAAGEFGAQLRQSLIPSLVLTRRDNERQGVFDADLFEIARVFLRDDPADAHSQPLRLGLITGEGFRKCKGIVEALVRRVNPQAQVSAGAMEHPGLLAGRAAQLRLDDRLCGWMGELDREGHPPLRDLKLRGPATVAEIDFSMLVAAASAERRDQPLPEFPAVVRDFNFVIAEQTTWDELARVARDAAGPWLERVTFLDQYQGRQVPAGHKSYVFSLTYRAPDRTLTGAEVDAAQHAVATAIEHAFGAKQR